ncbi:SBBP repeat-containing protein [Gloeobacter morelensis]|uniref:SBBP repeat-containing protein n=1 Tax=Gloeobacter morelensis TaxID=2907343 RepID=UPI001E3AD504|nr:SBBP repeat-containing protein [Gloeobacter morelensis]UFP97243.1 SBBP repeat-containing protein [Gloeobacter morelensis MG652769]
MGSSPGDQQARGVAADSQGNIYVAGSFTGADSNLFGKPIESNGGADAFLARFAAGSCTPDWLVTFGGRGTDYGLDVDVDSRTGEPVFVGTVAEGAKLGTFEAPKGGTFATRLEAQSGETVWVWFSEGGGGNEVALDSSGNTHVALNTSENIEIGGVRYTSQGRDAYLVKLSPTGAVLWSRQVGGPGEEQGRGIEIAPDGGALLAGFFEQSLTNGPSLTSKGGQDVFLIKYSPSGSIAFSRSWGSDQDDTARGVAADSQGIYLAGTFFGRLDFGTSLTIESEGAQDVFVGALDLAGNPRWLKRIGGTSADEGGEVEVSGGALYVAGQYSGGRAEFAQLELPKAEGSYDLFTGALNPGDGEALWVYQNSASRGNEINYGIAHDLPADRVITVGHYTKSGEIGGVAVENAGGLDAYLSVVSTP